MHTPSPAADAPEDVVAIVGVGLIGGSIAAAIKDRNLARHIIGVGRNAERLAEAKRRGLIDEFTVSPAEAARGRLVFVCTPIDRIIDDVRAIAGHASEGTLISDAGSVKRRICADLAHGLPEQVTFIGGHPLAGSELQGFEHADANLFQHRTCVLSPDAQAPQEQLLRLTRFWERLGSTVVEIDADRHDRILAQTSHLPHVIAAALAATLEDGEGTFASSGFGDTSRVAAGDPGLWVQILLENADELLQRIDAYTEQLLQFRQAMQQGDQAALKSLLEVAKRKRDALKGR